ncbi:ENR1 protein, partial [Mionectes macconnelli]|nr:ENR1 protein [Mionectes macconnelli]
IDHWKLYQWKGTKVNPFSGISGISEFWENIDQISEQFWKALDGLFWICGNRAYTLLPGKWIGCCTLGIIQPGFFLLPLNKKNDLGIPL